MVYLVGCVGHVCDCVGDGILLIPCICEFVFYCSVLPSSSLYTIWLGIVMFFLF